MGDTQNDDASQVRDRQCSEHTNTPKSLDLGSHSCLVVFFAGLVMSHGCLRSGMGYPQVIQISDVLITQALNSMETSRGRLMTHTHQNEIFRGLRIHECSHRAIHAVVHPMVAPDCVQPVARTYSHVDSFIFGTYIQKSE